MAAASATAVTVGSPTRTALASLLWMMLGPSALRTNGGPEGRGGLDQALLVNGVRDKDTRRNRNIPLGEEGLPVVLKDRVVPNLRRHAASFCLLLLLG